MANSDLIGSAGRVRRAAPLPIRTLSSTNSFCLTCAHWHFGSDVTECERCHSPIFRWLDTGEFRFMRSRCSLGAL